MALPAAAPAIDHESKLYTDEKKHFYFPVIHESLTPPKTEYTGRTITEQRARDSILAVRDIPTVIANYLNSRHTHIDYYARQSAAFHRKEAAATANRAAIPLSYLMIGSYLIQGRNVCYNYYPQVVIVTTEGETKTNIEKQYRPFVIVLQGYQYQYYDSHDVQWHRIQLNPPRVCLFSYLIRNIARKSAYQNKHPDSFLQYLVYNYNSYKHSSFANKSVHSLSMLISNMILVIIAKNFQTDNQVMELVAPLFPLEDWSRIFGRVSSSHVYLPVVWTSKENSEEVNMANCEWKCVKPVLPTDFKILVKQWIKEYDEDELLL